MKFCDYAERWLEAAQIAPKTREQYDYLLKRTNTALGHLPLEKLRVEHLQRFYKNLHEVGIKTLGRAATSTNLKGCIKAAKLTLTRLSELSGVSTATIRVAASVQRVSQETAAKLCAVLDKPVKEVFTLTSSSGKLSDRTVWHYNKLICAILSSAKKARIIPHNVTEFMETPKLPRTEARYYDDAAAREFLTALLDEPDIRIKTALLLDLFIGARKGELCGLTWTDIDLVKNTVHIRRASQYVSGHGVIETLPKNETSVRSVTISPFVTAALAEYRTWWNEQRDKCGDAWRGEKERLFIQEDGRPIFPSTINHWLRKFLERNKLPKITPHSLRHTFITLQIASGVDVRTVQSRSGHATASVLLNTYSHAVKSAQDRAAQAMDDVLLSAPKE